jgi:ribonuclease HII
MTDKNNEYICAEIIDDEDDTNLEDEDEIIMEVKPRSKKSVKQEGINEINEEKVIKNKKSTTKPLKPLLKQYFDPNEVTIEIGIDEAGRGPMFGRVYAGAVVLPKGVTEYNFEDMKDSKKFHSKKKIDAVAEYIKENSVAWAVEFEDETTIDEINILQATQSAMHKAIKNILRQLKIDYNENILLLVDGNYFKPYSTLNKSKTKLETIKHLLVEGGDNKYCSIASASILAKVERDNYIEKLCIENPELVEKYGIDSNKGYGSKKHMEGIRQYGITKWHRKTFGICKEYV